jgi:endonuclease YncB( thermonuclease family)
VETTWSDGDSFQIKTPDGKTQTIRLYGVDCIEMHVQGDDSNARRLRDQRRYFGINDISVAKTQGEAAKAATAKWLDKPFTVHTTFADGRGDGRFSRVYGFVKTADGGNLSEVLVSQGLARAFGVVRQLPDGTAGDEWMEQLKDLELRQALVQFRRGRSDKQGSKSRLRRRHPGDGPLLVLIFLSSHPLRITECLTCTSVRTMIQICSENPTRPYGRSGHLMAS